jgi:hypothetical protein
MEFHNSIVAVTIIINPVPPNANPLGMEVTLLTMYGKMAITPKNGPPIQFTRLNTLAMCRSVSCPFFTPGINLPLFSKFSDSCCGLIWIYE